MRSWTTDAGAQAADRERWAYCLRCGAPLTSDGSQIDGFGGSCYVKLDRGERERLRRGARESRRLSDDPRLGTRLHWLDRVGLRLGWIRPH